MKIQAFNLCETTNICCHFLVHLALFNVTYWAYNLRCPFLVGTDSASPQIHFELENISLFFFFDTKLNVCLPPQCQEPLFNVAPSCSCSRADDAWPCCCQLEVRGFTMTMLDLTFSSRDNNCFYSYATKQVRARQCVSV